MNDITALAQRNDLLIANGQQTAELLRHLADNEIDSDYFAVVSECESYGKETDAELSITEFALRAAGYVDALVEALEAAEKRGADMEVACELYAESTLARIKLEAALEKAQQHNGYIREQSAEWERKAISNFEECAEMSARIEELESQRKLAFTAGNRWSDKFREAEKRIAELERYHTAYMEWSDKTDWVQGDRRFDVVRPLGKHRADALKEYIEHLESRTVTPVTYSENLDADSCRKWAWEQVKGELSTEDWTTGDNINYFGFFCWGWDMRRQYNEQRTAGIQVIEGEGR